jgi:putative sterol carrier protein
MIMDISPYLQKMVDRFQDPKVQESLKGFTKQLLFKFTDTNEDWLVKCVDGREATFAKETNDKAEVVVTTTTETLSGVMDKKINAMAAYMQRKIQVKGAMEDLLKLQKIMM